MTEIVYIELIILIAIILCDCIENILIDIIKKTHINENIKNLQNRVISLKKSIFNHNRIYVFVMFFIIVMIIQFILVQNYKNNNEVVQGITIEIFGLVFDIILFGILIGVYDSYVNNKELINNYFEEIDDYRGWKEKEASYRIFGNIKRLLKYNKNDIDLTSCYFEDIDFTKGPFDSFDFKFFLFDETIFKKCNMSRTYFDNIRHNEINDLLSYCTTSYDKAIFEQCNMRDSSFTNNNYDGLRFINCDMSNSSFDNSEFYNCTFEDSKLNKATFQNTKFVKCKFYNDYFDDREALNMQAVECEIRDKHRSE